MCLQGSSGIYGVSPHRPVHLHHPQPQSLFSKQRCDSHHRATFHRAQGTTSKSSIPWNSPKHVSSCHVHSLVSLGRCSLSQRSLLPRPPSPSPGSQGENKLVTKVIHSGTRHNERYRGQVHRAFSLPILFKQTFAADLLRSQRSPRSKATAACGRCPPLARGAGQGGESSRSDA